VKERLTNFVEGIVWAAVALALVVLSFIVANRFYEEQSYAGKVADKFTQRAETQYGGIIDYYLIVEEKNGKRLKVRVNNHLYQQAQIGMEIEKPANSLEPRLSVQNR